MRRNRNNKHQEENQDRWMVSYADFITLLFAFFVVMYSISSVNEGKYRVLSESLTQAFSVAAKTLDPIQIGDMKRSGDPQSVEFIKRPVVIDRSDTPAVVPSKNPGSTKDAGDKPLRVLFEELQAAVAEISDKGLVVINNNEYGVEIEISSSILFSSGEVELAEQARPTISKLAEVLMPFPHQVNVQGYTDNIPIQSPYYPSNWQLSAARAASVVQLFTEMGMSPSRLSATGFGDQRPVAENSTVEGRQKNRRVVIFVPVLRDKRKVLDAIRQLGARMERGITYDQLAAPESSEGLRRDIQEPAAEIMSTPAIESRFFNAESGVDQLNSETGTIRRLQNPVDDDIIIEQSSQPHIGRQPIEGIRDSLSSGRVSE